MNFVTIACKENLYKSIDKIAVIIKSDETVELISTTNVTCFLRNKFDYSSSTTERNAFLKKVVCMP